MVMCSHHSGLAAGGNSHWLVGRGAVGAAGPADWAPHCSAASGLYCNSRGPSGPLFCVLQSPDSWPAAVSGRELVG